MQAIEVLRGSVDVRSDVEKGTEFSVLLPTTVSIMDALVVNVQQHRYAVPMQELVEIIDLQDFNIESSGKVGKMISIRGDIVPVESLEEYLPSRPNDTRLMLRTAGRKGTSRPALVVQHTDQFIAFEIDGILDQQQVVVRELNQSLTRLRGFSGCTVLGDGEPGMILNLPEIARIYFSRVRREEIVQ
jgi:two-component system chemotaxis sensor kinase CheA